MPVFNQGDNVLRALDGLIENIVSPFEIIVIDDGSEDATYSELLSWTRSSGFEERNFDFTLIRNKKSIFETACDNIGLRTARGDFLLEVQADMVIRDPEFEIRMMRAFQNFPSLAILSGRGVTTLDSIAKEYQLRKSKSFLVFALELLHSEALKIYAQVKNRIFPAQSEIEMRDFPIVSDPVLGYGRLGMAICAEIDGVYSLNEVFFGPYVMRGPLMIERSALKTLGYLDSDSFYLGFDDAEWCLRARAKGLSVAFHPVVFDSELATGATRKRRSASQVATILWMEWRSRRSSSKTLLWEYDVKADSSQIFEVLKLSHKGP
jgi:glycosyltransferase involved in cell wall biosynthesis